jgi:hypothetical protein
MDGYINPPEVLARERLRLEQDRRRRKHFPEEPQRDSPSVPARTRTAGRLAAGHSFDDS